MTDAVDLFAGFAARRIRTKGGEIYARIGGTGPPLLVLHGYPQTHMAWHAIAPALAQHFTLVVADLRGYGRSTCPPTDLAHRAYAKRTMAREMIEVMTALGMADFLVLGHGRGARVAYRMALDRPEVVKRLVLIEVLATPDQWSTIEAAGSQQLARWSFLAQPAPIPESLIAADPASWVDGRLKRVARGQSLDVFHPAALADYRQVMMDPDHVHATCEDYRAGSGVDVDDDEASLADGQKIACPMLLVVASAGALVDIADPSALWRRWCRDLTTVTVDSGHWVPEENPSALAAHAIPFLLAR
jgi:haloacetate dehalogenase